MYEDDSNCNEHGKSSNDSCAGREGLIMRVMNMARDLTRVYWSL